VSSCVCFHVQRTWLGFYAQQQRIHGGVASDMSGQALPQQPDPAYAASGVRHRGFGCLHVAAAADIVHGVLLVFHQDWGY
jgi:hypothetical protein